MTQAVTNCLRDQRTIREAQHLLAFSLLALGQFDVAAAALHKSVRLGNGSDWQPLVELALDHPDEVAKFRG